MKNKRGRIVSKKAHAAGKKRFEKYLSGWNNAVMTARKELGIKGMCYINGKTPQGKERREMFWNHFVVGRSRKPSILRSGTLGSQVQR